MGVKPGYKQTEVGTMPEDWEVCDLSSLVASGPKNGYSGRSGKKARGTPTLSLAATSSGRMILDHETVKHLEEVLEHDSDILLTAGDVLVQRSNTSDLVGTTAIFDGPSGVYGYPDLMMRLRFRARETAHWFWRYANSSSGRRYFGSVAAGSTGTMPKISGDSLRSMPLPLPPQHEQRAIAEALSDVDALLGALDRLIAKKRDLKQAAMQKLLTGQTRLPGFHDEWELKALGELGATFGGLTGKTKADFGDGSGHYISFMNVVSNVVIDCGSFEQVRISPSESQNRVVKGDLLFNGSSETPEEVALCAVLTADVSDLYLNSFCFGFRFRAGAEADGLFLAYYLRSDQGRELMKSLAQGSTRYNLSKVALLKSKLRLPRISEQTAISTVIADMDTELALLEQRTVKTRDLKQGMMQELLTGRTRLL